MLTKQFGALHMLILAAILSATILVGLGVIYFLDRATISSTLSKKDLQRLNRTEPVPNRFAVDSSQSNSTPTLGAAANPSAENPSAENPSAANPEAANPGAENTGAAKNATDQLNNQTLPNESAAQTERDINTPDSNEEIRAAVQRALEKIQENAQTRLNTDN